jgi:hypothetical protein
MEVRSRFGSRFSERVGVVAEGGGCEEGGGRSEYVRHWGGAIDYSELRRALRAAGGLASGSGSLGGLARGGKLGSVGRAAQCLQLDR